MPSDPARTPSLDATAIAAARGPWPEVRVPDADFAAYVAERLRGADLGALRLSDLYLACGCARGEAAAVGAFERSVLSRLPGVLGRAGADATTTAEVLQIVRARLLVGDAASPPRIVDYLGHGSLESWVRVGALRELTTQHRRDAARERAQPEPPEPPPTPEQDAIRARYGDLFQQAFRDAFQALPPEDRLLLRMHFAEGLNLDRLAAALGFSRATAGRRLLAARTALREATLELVGARLDATKEEVESVLVALRSQLEVSLGMLVSAA